MPILKKNNITIPQLGFGTWQLEGAVCEQSVLDALAVGYRHVDTAAAYSNHAFVGAAIHKSGIARSELFVTSKVWRDDLAPQNVRRACEAALTELGLDYLDLYLIHWPNRLILLADTLTALNMLQHEGLIRAFGVSNFTEQRLREALSTKLPILTNQVEIHPSFQQAALSDFCTKNDILVTAYSPLGNGADLTIPKIQRLAETMLVSPAQVCIARLLHKGYLVIPKATRREHIEENWQAQYLELSPNALTVIDSCEAHNRVINPSFAEFND